MDENKLFRIRKECDMWLAGRGQEFNDADIFARNILSILGDEGKDEPFDGTVNITMILDEKPLMNTTASLPRRVMFEWMSQMGFHIERVGAARGFPVPRVRRGPKIVCQDTNVCTDHPDKCPTCDGNNARSRFKPRKEEPPE